MIQSLALKPSQICAEDPAQNEVEKMGAYALGGISSLSMTGLSSVTKTL